MYALSRCFVPRKVLGTVGLCNACVSQKHGEQETNVRGTNTPHRRLKGITMDRERSLVILVFLALVPALPGQEFTFQRGDADASGGVNITDAVFILGFLFQGARAPTCMDAADANDDGAVDLSDPVRILNALFASEPPLQMPSDACLPDTPRAYTPAREMTAVKMRSPGRSRYVRPCPSFFSGGLPSAGCLHSDMRSLRSLTERATSPTNPSNVVMT